MKCRCLRCWPTRWTMHKVIAEARFIRGHDGKDETVRLIEIPGRKDPYWVQVNYNNDYWDDFLKCSTHKDLERAEAGFELLCSYREQKGWHRVSALELLGEQAE